MKQIKLIILVFFALIRVLYAQPIISTSWLPSPGDKYYCYTPVNLYAKTAWKKCSADSGANKVWDFSYLEILDLPDDSLDFVLPSTRSIPFSNSQTNLSSGSPVGFWNFIKNNQGLHVVEYKERPGTDGRGNFYVNYSNPRTVMAAGLSFRGTHRDTANYIYYWDNQLIDSFHKGVKYQQITYDGYGVLKLMDNTYDSAVRYHIKVYQRDSSFYGGAYHHIIDLYDIYEWYVPNIHSWTFTIASNVKAEPWDGRYDTTAREYWASLTRLPNLTSSTAFPQVKERIDAIFQGENLLIKLNGPAVGAFSSYWILDSQGRQVKIGNLDRGTSVQQVSTVGLQDGVYLLHLQMKNGQHEIIKLIK